MARKSILKIIIILVIIIDILDTIWSYAGALVARQYDFEVIKRSLTETGETKYGYYELDNIILGVKWLCISNVIFLIVILLLFLYFDRINNIKNNH
mgnify:CR=1 FL=1